MRLRLQNVMLLVLALTYEVQALGVLSFDLGTHWLKIGLVKRGVPADMVLNNESKRKTPLALYIDERERLFGNPAKSTGLRFPANLYEYLPTLLGQKFDHPLVKYYQEQFPHHELIRTDRDTVAFKTKIGTISVEELVAMLLENAKEVGSEFAREPINDVVITVPAFWAQAERKSLLYAADLVGINVLQLMDDNTAVAYSYGVFNQKLYAEKPLNVLFYDQGASKTMATVVEFQALTSPQTGTKTPGLKITGMAYDRLLGGHAFEHRLRDHLVKLFEEQTKGKHNVRKSPRGMAKLMKEAQRVKEVLSANSETFAEVEGVLVDVNFARTKVTRREFEEMCADLFDRTTQPLTDALLAAGATIDDMDHVIMFGGGQRIPKIHQKLREAIGGRELSKGINSDEAAAIGAVLCAASHSKGFRVKEFDVQDSVLYPITVTYAKAQDNGQDGKSVSKVLYSANGKFPEIKLLGFNRHMKDFSFTLSYGDIDFLSKRQRQLLGSKDILRVDVVGLEEAIEKNAKMGYMGTKVRFELDYSCVVHVDSVNATFNATGPPTLAGKVLDKVTDMLGLKKEGNGAGEEGAEEVAADNMADAGGETPPKDTADDKGTEDGKQNTTDKAENTNSTEEQMSSQPAQKASKVKKVPLRVTVTHLDLVMPDAEAMHEARKRLAQITAEEKQRRLAMEAKHQLESTVYSTLDLLDAEDVAVVATAEELESVRTYLRECSDWLYGDGEEATADKYTERLGKIKALILPMLRRREEMLTRPAAVEELQKAFKRLEKLAKLSEDEKHFTEDDYQRVAKAVAQHQTWLEDKLREQDALPPTNDPVLLTSDLQHRARRINRDIKALRDMRPSPKKNDSTANGTDTTTTTTKADTVTGDAGKPGRSKQDGQAKPDREPAAPADEEPIKDEL